MTAFEVLLQSGGFHSGASNTICDVMGVRVGHQNLRGNGRCTGVTAVLPHGGDLYRTPVRAGCAVLNGFGKSAGLVQVEELGEIETPVLLTNTFGVGTCSNALIRRAIAQNSAIGRGQATVNPLVLECNDGKVNDIQQLAVSETDAEAAIAAADNMFEQGTIGAGSGMKTFGFAGGIGSASRLIQVGATEYTLGSLVLSNFGEAGELRVYGDRVPTPDALPEPDTGSIIILLATDAPMESRQLTRLARRSAAALGRLGSYLGHQSGDIALAFSTANQIERGSLEIHPVQSICESRMNTFFKAGVESVEAAILGALWYGTSHEAYDGTRLPTFRDAYQMQTQN
ncbi:P1 family peptidase [Sedimentitalea sp. XS_ASV28]|uniref:P1 family peptidase n=1 Tax=Sedimentitalea sp. XS_ASV28 TaxID=3241296 RepID=UPI0035139AFD